MIQYIDAKGSPFAADAPTTLQNIVTKEIMSEKVRHDILMASTKGKEKYIAYRKCVFVEKSQRISSTINRLNLNTMANNTSKPEKTTKARVKEINIMDRNIEVARERGLTSQDLLQYDVVPSPMLFDDDGLMTKPDKSQLIQELKGRLKPEDYSFQCKSESAFIIDVMAGIRKVNTAELHCFDNIISLFKDMNGKFHQLGRCDYIFDIYNDSPNVKDTERLRRCSSSPIVLSSIESSTPIPKDMSTFWSSSKNKELLEKHIYEHLRQMTHTEPTVLSQVCLTGDQWQCIKLHNGTEQSMQQLQSTVEEADLRIPMHVLDCTQEGYTTCVVISNDTDVIVSLLYHFSNFQHEGLHELWVRAGRGDTARFVPIHMLSARMGPDICKVLPAVHSLTECDITSKIGTKKAALKANPVVYLNGFGATAPLTPPLLQQAEEYLVQVVALGTKCVNFNQLRAHQFRYTNGASHQNIPPTSQGLTPHIHRAFFNTYTIIHALDKQLHINISDLCPLDFGFVVMNDALLPSTLWRSLESHWSLVCSCGKCARSICPCRTAMMKCSVFCKCNKADPIDCRNPYK